MKAIGIIPARYDSSRFPGKPLHEICGISMIQRVYQRAIKANLLEKVLVATDDERIFNHVKSFDGNVVMTSKNHQSGTDRCREALETFEKQNHIIFDVVVNIQGDEPLINPQNINVLVEKFLRNNIEIATLKRLISDNDELFSPNVVKVITDYNDKAIYFSRNPLPFIAGMPQNEWITNQKFYKHIGIYAFRSAILQKITNLAVSNLEKCEKLEQLRWIENAYAVNAYETLSDVYAVDVPEDVKKIEYLIKNNIV
jgi:3-deoxy-manno-octulosonate cytidylyltransferase (CMP-KDO synthetase)